MTEPMPESDMINGWKPPTIYDATTDATRIATQEDVDRMSELLIALSLFRNDIRRLLAGVDAVIGGDRRG